MSFQLLGLLQMATVATFLGHGIKLIFWGGPFRDLFWDKAVMGPFVSIFLGLEWRSYVENLAFDHFINAWTTFFGGVFIVCALLCLRRELLNKRPMRIILSTGSFFLSFTLYFLFKQKHYQLPLAMEYAAQASCPVLFLFFQQKLIDLKKLTLFAKIAVALTFLGHGIYAMGVLLPVPGNFLDMAIKILGINESDARDFLFVMGFIDVIVAVSLFVPKMAKTAALYAAFWGLVTALARPVSGVHMDYLARTLLQWGPEFILRTSHFLLPWAIFEYYSAMKRDSSEVFALGAFDKA